MRTPTVVQEFEQVQAEGIWLPLFAYIAIVICKLLQKLNAIRCASGQHQLGVSLCCCQRILG
jgi:hypothetical protein